MKNTTIALALIGLATFATGATAADPRAVALLFGADSHGLSQREQSSILDLTGLRLAPSGDLFLDAICALPAAAAAQFFDLNHDGVPEVLVVFGNSCTSGLAGQSLGLFVKRGGRYRFNLGFPGISATPLATGNLGYDDLLIGGPGNCAPVWRWSGREYEFLRNQPQAPGGCNGR